MRMLIPALLALTPALLHAQATSPAQPRSQATVLQAKLTTPIAATTVSAANASAVRVSSLVEPKLIKVVNLETSTSALDTLRGERDVTVALTVDPQGVPTDLKVVTPAGGNLDRRVLKAVSQFRYVPGTLNAVPTSFPMTLKVTVVPITY